MIQKCKQQVASKPRKLCDKPAVCLVGTYRVPTCADHAAKLKGATRYPLTDAKK